MEFEHKWSPEPWEWGDNAGTDAMTIWDSNDKPLFCPCLMADAQDLDMVVGIKKYAKLAMVTPNPFDGPRMTRCVNACAGIPNPDKIGDLVKAAWAAFYKLNSLDEGWADGLALEDALHACGIKKGMETG